MTPFRAFILILSRRAPGVNPVDACVAPTIQDRRFEKRRRLAGPSGPSGTGPALKSLRGKPNRYFRWGAKGISIGRIPTYRSTLNHGPDAFASRFTARNQPDCQLRFDAGRHVERTRPAGGGS